MPFNDPGPWTGYDLDKPDQSKVFLNKLVEFLRAVALILQSPASIAKYTKNFLTFTNVLIYGADPSGVNDSTTAIANAIASMTNGGTLYFPAGTYTVSSTI